MYTIAIKMLLGDKAKYIMLVSALSFAALLMTQQSCVFAGLMRWTTATLRNTGVPVWVVDPNVVQVNEVKPMRTSDLNRVRSVSGVSWAVPYYFSLQQARLYDGKFKSVQLMGADSATLIGTPPVLLQGRLEDLWQANAVIVDEVGIAKLSEGRDTLLKMGDIFDINDHDVRIVGICKSEQSIFGHPFIYTTFDRAIQIAPKTRRNVAYILVEPSPGISAEAIAERIEKETGLRAFTKNAFEWSTIWWFVHNTGIPFSFGSTILLGFIVGLAVAGQTFFSFILENFGNLGALKAMGAGNGLLCRMLILQASLVGFIGYGIGIGITSLFGFGSLKKGQPPYFMPYEIPVITFFLILFICAFSAILAIRKVRKLEPHEVFRV